MSNSFSIIENQNEENDETITSLNLIVELLEKKEEPLQKEPSFIETSKKQMLLERNID